MSTISQEDQTTVSRMGGKTCSFCHEKNHLVVKCHKKRNVGNVASGGVSEEEYIDIVAIQSTSDVSVNAVGYNKYPDEVFAEMLIDDKPVRFQIDSGATVNLLPVAYAPSDFTPTTKVLAICGTRSSRSPATLYGPTYISIHAKAAT